MINTRLKEEALSDMVTNTTSSFTNLKSPESKELCLGYAMTLNVVVDTPAAGTLVAVAATDVCTTAAHDFTTGLKVQLTTSNILPAGLALATDYFVIVIDSSTYKLASSYANAIAGTNIDITSTGTGTHTITPVAIAGASYKTQVSTNSVNWVDLAAASNITASTTVLVEKLDPMYDYLQVVYTITSGRMSIQQNLSVKGY